MIPMAAEHLLKDALQLSEEQRAKLAIELLDSLEPAIPTQSRNETDWPAEIERRARAAHAGEPGDSWDEVRAHITNRLPRK
jgi:putative addiction module component (TIGR02574 family)